MKNLKPFLVVILLFVLINCSGSSDKLTPENDDPKVDMTLNYNPPSSASQPYQTFFKPVNAVTGDPMPFYNEKDDTFYVYFLLGNFTGYSKGGIYLTKTKDFANFQLVSEEILTGEVGDIDLHIGTGSIIEKDNSYNFFYTGFNDGPIPSAATKATSNKLSGSWMKVPSLVIGAPAGYEKAEFRDPHVYWDDTRNKYVMLVGSRSEGKSVIARFQSDDLTEWQPIESIYSTTSNNPKKFEIETDTWIVECPDIFKLGNKWYMVFSRLNRDEHRKTYYRIADNPDGPWMKAKDDKGYHETFDGLYLYAAKTVSDGENRYISGWASSGQKRQSNGELSWGGMLITHKLVQQPNGKLYPSIPEAVSDKFSQAVALKDIKRKGTVAGDINKFTMSNNAEVVFNRIPKSTKIELKIDATKAKKGFGIAFGAHENQDDAYKLTFDLSSTNKYNTPALFMTHRSEEYNFTPLIVPPTKIFNVEIVIERQICVMYVNGNVAFTNTISNMEENPWMIFSENDEVVISDIKIYK